MIHFDNRQQAGALLAEKLGEFTGAGTIVLGIPGGGVVVGAPIAAALGAPLQIVQVDPVARAGRRRAATERMRDRAGSARAFFSPSGGGGSSVSSERAGGEVSGASMPDVKGRTVIIVEDGLHDDLEVHRTLIAFRGRGAAKLVLAVPFIAAETAERHRSEVDEIVALHTLVELVDPRSLYGDPASPSIEEVRALLTPASAAVVEAEAPALYQNILVPVDFSDPSERAVREALRLQAAGGGLVTLFNVASSAPIYGDDGESMEIRRQQPLISFAEKLVPPGANVVLRLGSGEPARQILQEVIDGDHDLVVMGTNGRRGLQGALFGSVAAQVVRDCLAPVLVTR